MPDEEVVVEVIMEGDSVDADEEVGWVAGDRWLAVVIVMVAEADDVGDDDAEEQEEPRKESVSLSTTSEVLPPSLAHPPAFPPDGESVLTRLGAAR